MIKAVFVSHGRSSLVKLPTSKTVGRPETLNGMRGILIERIIARDTVFESDLI